MRALIQVVKNASVKIEGKEVASIGKGFLIFSGFTSGDNEEILRKMAVKIAKLRLFMDAGGKTNLALGDVNGNVLSVSQFTLYASAKDGNRPSFVSAAPRDLSEPLFDKWNEILKEYFPAMECGVFGADMEVELINDGPFTLWLDSDEIFGRKAG